MYIINYYTTSYVLIKITLTNASYYLNEEMKRKLEKYEKQ